MANPYESDQLLAEYLLFHYGTAEETLPYPFGPREALGFPIRCVSECLDRERLPRDARALDLGCAVGRSTFELARYCQTSIGIDASRRFIAAAASLQRDGACVYARRDEGDLRAPLTARVPTEIDRRRVRFALGDAAMLPLGDDPFDVVLLANLIDRLPEPGRCLEQLSRIIKPGGQLIITSPYTWLEEFTPREHWLGGYARRGPAHTDICGAREAPLGFLYACRTKRSRLPHSRTRPEIPVECR